MITAERLLAKLPPFRDEWVLVKQRHKVTDIVQQVLSAHDQFAKYYNKIALSFNAKTVDQVCENLDRFCKKEIRYREESDTDQTTSLPAGILTRRYGDCKHYANFCGGVLDALTRLTGKKINWCYRFASYELLNRTPHHVFIVVHDNGGEIWLDPVPGAEIKMPVWQVDKKIKAKYMPLYNNIGSVHGSNSSYFDDERKLGFIDPEIAVAVGEQVIDFIKKFTDKVPNYPIKSQNTLKSLTAQIDAVLPLPPASITDAKRLLAIAIKERALSVGRGNDVATQTAIIMWDERITALQNYINSGGGAFSLPPAGSGATATHPTLTNTGQQSTTAGLFSSPLLLLGLGGAAIYMLTKKKTSVRGADSFTPVLIGLGAILLIKNMNKPPAVMAGVPWDPIDTAPQYPAPSTY